jgi:hypothetical protein
MGVVKAQIILTFRAKSKAPLPLAGDRLRSRFLIDPAVHLTKRETDDQCALFFSLKLQHKAPHKAFSNEF